MVESTRLAEDIPTYPLVSSIERSVATICRRFALLEMNFCMNFEYIELNDEDDPTRSDEQSLYT
jgi:hypothetical protein